MPQDPILDHRPANHDKPGMRPSRRAFLVGAAAVTAAPALARTGRGPTGKVTLLHTNDFHGRHSPVEVAPGGALAQTGRARKFDFDRRGRIGGLPALAAAVAERRREVGAERVLLVDGGDTFSDDLLGNLTDGEAMIRLMNAVGYDLMVLGNHDFDYGVARTRELADMARFPIRAGNVVDAGTGEPAFGDPVLVRKIDGITVGVLALGYHNTPLTTSAENIKGLRFTDGIEVARKIVPELRRHADVVVVVSHQGTAVDRHMLGEIEGIDLVIGAHSHDLITPPERVGGGWLVQALSDGAVLGEVTLTVEDGAIVSVEGMAHMLWADRFDEDAEVAALLADFRAPHAEALDERIAEAAEQIGRNYKEESPFDKLAGRILREETGADVAMLPGVGYGVALTPGPITAEALRRLLPHPAKAATLTLTGKQIQDVLEQNATNLAPGDPRAIVGGLIQTDGIAWTIDMRRPVGTRVTEISIGGRALEPGRSYTVVANAGMLRGLHNYDTVGKGEGVTLLDQSLPELVAAGFRRAGQVQAPAVGDVTLIDGGT